MPIYLLQHINAEWGLLRILLNPELQSLNSTLAIKWSIPSEGLASAVPTTQCKYQEPKTSMPLEEPNPLGHHKVFLEDKLSSHIIAIIKLSPLSLPQQRNHHPSQLTSHHTKHHYWPVLRPYSQSWRSMLKKPLGNTRVKQLDQMFSLYTLDLLQTKSCQPLTLGQQQPHQHYTPIQSLPGNP